MRTRRDASREAVKAFTAADQVGRLTPWQTRRVDPGFWRGRRVLLTGHTGFKGAWLALWLTRARGRGHRLRAGARHDAEPLRGRCPRRADRLAARRHPRRRRPCERVVRRAPAGGRAPPRRPGAGAPLVRRSGRHVRDERDGHGPRPRRGATGRRAVGRRRRHQRQVLREPGVVVAVPRGRRAGRPRPVQQQQGGRRARRRRRGGGRSSPHGRHRSASPRREPATSSAAATGPTDRLVPDCVRSFAAGEPVRRSATPAPRVRGSTCSSRWPATSLLAERLAADPDAVRRGVELRPGRRRRPPGGVGGRAARPSVGRRCHAGSATRPSSPTRPGCCRSTRPRREPGSAGRRGCALDEASTGPSSGTAPSPPAPTPRR